MTQVRRPAGTPTGGQFATVNRPAASGVELTDDDLVEPSEPSAAETAASDTRERLAALAPLCRYGSDYDRGVASAVSDHHHFAGIGEPDAAEHYLLIAELRAGYIEFEEFDARDPFERVAKERRVAAAAQEAEVDLEAAEKIGMDVEDVAVASPASSIPESSEPPLAPKLSGEQAIARIFPGGEPRREVRRHKLLTAELAEQIPGLYDSEGTPVADKTIYAHYFTGSADWHIAELDRETGEMFGRCDLGLGFPEWGYVRIQDLAELRGQFGLPVERDTGFKPRTARELGLEGCG